MPARCGRCWNGSGEHGARAGSPATTIAPTAACWRPWPRWPSPAAAAWTSEWLPIRSPSFSPRRWASWSGWQRYTSPRRVAARNVQACGSCRWRRSARINSSASNATAQPCSPRPAPIWSASGRQPATRCSAGATTRRAPRKSSTPSPRMRRCSRTAPDSTPPRTLPRPSSPAVVARGWRSCANRASTARSKWPRPSTAPDSRPWTST